MTFCHELCCHELYKNGCWTDRFAVWVVDEAGPEGSTSSIVYARLHQYALMRRHIGATWWIRFYHLPAVTMRTYVKLVWPLVNLQTTVPHLFVHCNTPFTRYNRLSNRIDNRFDNRVERTATVRSTWLSNRVVQPVWQLAVYTIQPLVKPVWQPIWQPVWELIVSCKQTFNLLSNLFDNRVDNRLYRVNRA